MKNILLLVHRNSYFRIGSHLLFWLLLYIYLLFTSFSVDTNHGIFSSSNVFFKLGIVSISIICHYILVYAILRSPKQKQRVFPIVLCFILYLVCSFLFMHLVFLMGQKFPEITYFKILGQTFEKKEGLVSLLNWYMLGTTYAFVISNNVFAFLIKICIQYTQTIAEKNALEMEKKDMELHFLKSQIQPHFLFNTLNNIYSLTLDNDRASTALLKLSDLLRFSLYETQQKRITISREIEILHEFIDLEQIRHTEKRFAVNFDHTEIQNSACLISPLILINFVENAFKHSINTNKDKSWVRIHIKEKNGLVTFQITNNVGHANNQKQKKSLTESGLGLKNVRRRLDIEYLEKYDLSIKHTSQIFEVKLTLNTLNH